MTLMALVALMVGGMLSCSVESVRNSVFVSSILGSTVRLEERHKLTCEKKVKHCRLQSNRNRIMGEPGTVEDPRPCHPRCVLHSSVHTQSSQRPSHRDTESADRPPPEGTRRGGPGPAFLMPIADVMSRKALTGRPVPHRVAGG